eukprot:23653-Amphidinium_carterae.1
MQSTYRILTARHCTPHPVPLFGRELCTPNLDFSRSPQHVQSSYSSVSMGLEVSISGCGEKHALSACREVQQVCSLAITEMPSVLGCHCSTGLGCCVVPGVAEQMLKVLEEDTEQHEDNIHGTIRGYQ